MSEFSSLSWGGSYCLVPGGTYLVGSSASDIGVGIVDAIGEALGSVAAPLIALIRLVRDGERASDATIAGCGSTPALDGFSSTNERPFPYGGVGGITGATTTALKAIGPRGVARATAIHEANVTAFRQMMGR